MQLKTLTYTSRAALDLTSADLLDIHQKARRRNALDRITGLLIFNGVHFLQIVEGGDAALDDLMMRLRRDHRHTAVEIRHSHTMAERAFAEWSMELVQVSSERFTARQEIASALPWDLQPEIRERVLAMTDGIGQAVSLPD